MYLQLILISKTQLLPYEKLEWCDTNMDVTTIPDDSSIEYILEDDQESRTPLRLSHKSSILPRT